MSVQKRFLLAACLSLSACWEEDANFNNKSLWAASLPYDHVSYIGQAEQFLRANGVKMTFTFACPTLTQGELGPVVGFSTCLDETLGREYKVFFDRETKLPISYEEVGAPKPGDIL